MLDTNTKGFRGQRKGQDTYILDDSEDWLGHEATNNDTCYWCIHWHKNKPDYDLRAPVRLCDAFDEVPWEIWTGEVSHTKPYPGDRGIQFESRLKKSEEYLNYDYFYGTNLNHITNPYSYCSI